MGSYLAPAAYFNRTSLMTKMISLLLRLSVAFVWLYQGLWHKIFEVSAHHRAIMIQALGETWGPLTMKTLGFFEVTLGVLVLLHYKPKLMALIQVALLIGMNGAGLFFAAKQIPDIGGMLTMNFVFIMAILTNTLSPHQHE